MCSDAQAAGGAFWGHAEDSALQSSECRWPSLPREMDASPEELRDGRWPAPSPLDGCLLLGVATAGPCGSGAGRHRRGPPGLGTGRTARRRVLRSRHVAWLRRQVSMAAAAAEPGQRKADHNAALLELPPGDFSAELCVGDPDKEESAERAGAPEGLKYEDQLPEREDWRPLTSSAGLLGKETYEDLLPLTGYAIKFAKEFVDFRVDLELPVPRSLAEGLPGVVLCIKDGEEGEDDYVSPSDEEWNSEDEFVEEHWKGNPLSGSSDQSDQASLDDDEMGDGGANPLDLVFDEMPLGVWVRVGELVRRLRHQLTAEEVHEALVIWQELRVVDLADGSARRLL
mmetsp:Transcript_93605/g.292778  ORF Transcript_93605/g.292778 Transcript_93605/m.292778 type:complete len:341 (+) Transcript_93605:95-1117(+)